MSGCNGLHSAQTKDTIFACINNFYTVFGHFTQKALKNIAKPYLGHVPINRSHQMNNHFLQPEVTTYQFNTQMFRNHDIFLFHVPTIIKN